MFARLLLVLLVALGASAQKQPSPVQEAQAAARQAEDAARAAIAAKTEAEKQRDETLKRLDTVAADMVGRAAASQSTASFVITFVSAAVTIFGVLGAIAAYMGGVKLSDSLKKVKSGEKIAKEAAARIVEMKKGIEEHKLFMSNLELQLTRVLEEIKIKLDAGLTPATELIGVDRDAPVPQRSYDDDALIVFCERLQITSDGPKRELLPALLLKMANYWRRTKEYGRAIERVRRAVELDPSSVAAHKILGRAIWNGVAEDLSAGNTMTPLPAQLALLNEAQTELQTAQTLLAQQSRHDEEIEYDFGMVLRLKGQFAEAIIHYRAGADLSKVLAQSENREPDWDFEYALACLYAKTSQYPQAFDQIKAFIGKKKSWSQDRSRAEDRDYRDWMRSDPDFADMRADAAWGSQLAML